MQNQKYIILTFVGAAVLLGMSVQGLTIPLLARLEVADPQIFGLFNATTFAGIVVAALSFALLNRQKTAVAFTNEVIDELRKVAWPDKQETLRSTLVVVVFTVVVAGALGG